MLLLIQRAISLSCAFISTYFLVNRLGVDLFGKYSYAVALISPLYPMASFGIKNILIVKLFDSSHKWSLIKNGFFVEILGSSLILLIIFLICNIIKLPDFTQFSLGLLICANYINAFEVYECYLISKQKLGALALIEIVISIIGLLIKSYIFFGGYSAYLMSGSYLAEPTLRAALFLLHGLRERKVKHNLKFSFDVLLLNDLMKSGLSLSSASLISGYTKQIPMLVSGYLGLFDVTGAYAIFSKVPESLSTFLAILQQKTIVNYTEKLKKEPSVINKVDLMIRLNQAKRYLQYFNSLSYLLVLGSALISPIILLIFFKKTIVFPITYCFVALPMILISSNNFTFETLSIFLNRKSRLVVKELILTVFIFLLSMTILPQVSTNNSILWLGVIYAIYPNLNAILSSTLLFTDQLTLSALYLPFKNRSLKLIMDKLIRSFIKNRRIIY